MYVRRPSSRGKRLSKTRVVVFLVGLAALVIFTVEIYALNRYQVTHDRATTQQAPARRMPDPPGRSSSSDDNNKDALKDLIESRHRLPPSNHENDPPPPPSALPKLDVFVERIRAALHPFTMTYTATRPITRLVPSNPKIGCGETWSSQREGTFLSGCPDHPEGCKEFTTLGSAQRFCSNVLGAKCGGVTREDRKAYSVRASSVPQISPNDDVSWVKVADPCLETKPKKSSARDIWEAFHLAVDSALDDADLHLQTPLGPPREDGSIFVSIASYRDFTCKDTLKRAFERADDPDRISAGIVQQNCMRASGCMTGTGWAETRRWVKSKTPDADCAEEFCRSELGRRHCEEGRVRILRLDEIDSLGPFFTRFLNSKLWRGENFYLQIDAHTDFRQGWDTSLAAQMRATATYPNSVISNYPPGGTPQNPNPWPALQHPTSPDGKSPPSALCSCSFETAGRGRMTVRLAQSGRTFTTALDVPRKSCFVAAGFFVAHGSIVDNVGFDPFLPYLFMGEELALSARFYTSGYDLYAPSADVLQHEYVRKESPKFWETVGEVYSNSGLHNELTDLIVQRVQFLDAFPEADDPKKLDPPSLLVRMDQFGLGKKRTAVQFNERVGLDLVNKRQRSPMWCVSGADGAGGGERLDFDLLH